jgi:HAD superfamily hydrolase (TIGR01509 family)
VSASENGVGSEAPAPVAIADIDAWIFDLDGVLTDTASLHERAWHELFDQLFTQVEGAGGAKPPPFTSLDYQRLVDGEARTDGVRNVLRNRAITLPEGSPDDPPGYDTVASLAAEKDARYLALLAEEGPRPFPTSVALVERLHGVGMAIGVVSASRHCQEVLVAAGLSALVDARVDGIAAAAMNLAGKPSPDMFTEAARALGVEPRRAVVVEDALAGVEAGRRGGFDTVIGVDRVGQAEELRRHGANVVVADLAQVDPIGPGPETNPWRHRYVDPQPDQEGVMETLYTLANGYLGTRGARPWAHDDGISYPGTYLAGVYNRLTSPVAGRTIEVESLVNAPNWLPVSFRTGDGPWLGDDGFEVSSHRITLDLRGGILLRRCTVTDPQGRRTAVVERRVVSMADPHLMALELSFIPLDWSGRLQIRAGLDASVRDAETVEDRLLATRHLELVDQGASEGGDLSLRVRTIQSRIVLALAARCRLGGVASGQAWRSSGADGCSQIEAAVSVSPGARVTLEKMVAVFTSKDYAISEPAEAARGAVAVAPNFGELLRSQRASWEQLWRRAQVDMGADPQSSATVNLHLFHTLQVASPHVAHLDTGLGARGLHGEGYRGHVFWDTLFVFPLVNMNFPEVARSLFGYRSLRLPAARLAAAAAGYEGAMFPWQSGSDGRDETPTVLFNPQSGHWIRDNSHLQRHVGLAIAYDAWQFGEVSGDYAFRMGPGAELLVEVARFFARLASWDGGTERYHIAGVMGPDEFHDGYPWSDAPGIVDNAYTNAMTAWLLWRTRQLVNELLAEGPRVNLGPLDVSAEELEHWDSISRRLHIPFHDGVISQFADYERLEPFDLEGYRRRYGNVGRLDLILEAEGDAVRRYQVAKQADVLMLLYLLSAEELRAVFERLGYSLSAATIKKTVAYYAARATHGSTLSRPVHAWVLARSNRRASWRYFQEALAADVTDSQGGTTREGIHLGAMASTVDILQRCYVGLEVRGGALWLNPQLPLELGYLRFAVDFRGCTLTIDADHRRLRVVARAGMAPVTVMVGGAPQVLAPGGVLEVPVGVQR